MKAPTLFATVAVIASCSRTPLNGPTLAAGGTDVARDSGSAGLPERDGAGTTVAERDSAVVFQDTIRRPQEAGSRDAAVPSPDVVVRRPDTGRPDVVAIPADALLTLRDAESVDRVPAPTDTLSAACSNQLLAGHSAAVGGVAFSPDGQFLASASLDHLGKIWRVGDGALVHTMTGSAESMVSVAYSPDGQTLVTGGGDTDTYGSGAVRLWLNDGTLLWTSNTAYTYSVAFSPDGKTVASANIDNQARLWSAATGQLLRTISGDTDYVSSVAFTPDGTTLATASWDATIRLWDASSGALQATLAGTIGPYLVAISPDGKLIAGVGESSTGDPGLEIWSLPDHHPIQTIYAANLEGLTFTPDGKFVVTSGPRVWVFAVSDGSLVDALGESTTSVAVCPDGTRIAAGEPQGALKIFCWK